ncbi:MAG: adenylyl-sulfate kinase [Phycisphaerae bacterium]|jgi:adenylylsulfate kinase|nr:adenylyl-sulfate kinase [Phycisphaerae bacterium]MCZ2399112.1 adenylyl-sulfate kinase [Phycisphaerae bacterium]NUQ48931.1 adenylyl-sulfate kinase [Phycisphaerae bacterium]
MSKTVAANITWHEGHVERAQRYALLRQRGATIWLTGLSASGKSTIAFTAEHLLVESGRLAYVLDGDNIRHGLNRNLGFSPEDRTENIRRIGEVAKLFADAGVLTFASFISPYRADRDLVRGAHRAAGLPFIEVYVRASVEVCEQRDPKGLYKKARAGQLPEFTGVSAPYEEPLSPEVVIDSNRLTPGDAASRILDYLRGLSLLTA